ncbi:ABC transporter ATP-binding protein [Actinomycetospora sp. OC33-EN08]|uniref:ABC transporter ATP-binding protein n=1 Tax=Actinomycetospora aurantiaca TaxID=3129233 RepID=A0ABU8MUP7_9PSEU
MGEPLIGAEDVETPRWAVVLEATAQAGVLAVARAVPRTMRTLVGWAWAASPRWTVLTGVIQVLSGVVTASGLLATASVFTQLLTDGPTPERVVAALPALAVVAAALVLRGGLDALSGGSSAVLVPLVEQRAQDELYRSLVETDLVAFEDPDFTSLVEQAGPALLRIRSGAQMVGDLLAGVISVVAATVTAGLIHPVLAPVVLLAAIPQAWANLSGIRVMFGSHLAMASRSRRLSVTGSLISERTAAAEVRAFTSQDVLLAEHRRIAADLAAEGVRVALRRNVLTTLGRALSGVGAALGYVVLGLLLFLGGLPLALAGTAVIAMRTAASAVVTTVTEANFLFEAGLFIDLYRECVDQARRHRRGVVPDPRAARPDPVELRGVSFRYPDQEADAVHDVDLVLRRGETVALVGENGSGKSTLAKLVVGLYLPDAGEVRWGGVPTTSVDPRVLHDQVALVLQEPLRWPMTAANNVRIGRLGRADEPAYVDALTRSGADEVFDGLPQGPSTVLSREFQQGRDLSGGQWQRIAVARGLFRDAALVVADEPTAALDARAEHGVFSALRELSADGDRVTVLVTHRLANIRSADRIVVMEDGRIAEEGDHDALMALEGIYAELFRLQGRAYAERPA